MLISLLLKPDFKRCHAAARAITEDNLKDFVFDFLGKPNTSGSGQGGGNGGNNGSCWDQDILRLAKQVAYVQCQQEANRG